MRGIPDTNGRSMNILLLLVEDDPTDLANTITRIRSSRLPTGEPAVARTLREAQNLLRQSSWDVVLLDLNLPDSRGLETLDAVRSLHDGVLVVLTSPEDEPLGFEAIRRGADDYLVKTRVTDERLRVAVLHSAARCRRRETAGRVSAALGRLDAWMAAKPGDSPFVVA